MAIWEREIFEREYADANWYKGKQKKYVEGRDVAEARGRASLGGHSIRSFTHGPADSFPTQC